MKEFEWINNRVELDFGGQVAVRLERTSKGIKVLRAMDFDGNNILEKVEYYGIHKVLHEIEAKVGGKIEHCHLSK